MGFSCAGKCGMVFLITVNTIFLLLGLATLITGILMIANIDVLDDEEITRLLNNVELNDNLSLGTIVQHLAKLVIGVGVFIFLIALLGALGACCKNRIMLVVYAILVLLIFIVQIVAIALFAAMKDTVENKAKSALKSQLDKYTGTATTDENSVSWNLLFVGFKCCGVNAVTTTDNDFDTSTWNTGGTAGANEIPYSCCTAATQDNYATGSDTACQNTPSTYHTTGCYQKFKDWLSNYQTAAIVVGSLILIVEILGVIFAFIICKNIGDKDMIV